MTKLSPVLQIMEAFWRTGAQVQDDAIVEFQEVVKRALTPQPQPLATLPTNPGTHVLVNDRRFGWGEALLFDNGDWGLASFNGQVIKAEPLEWMPLASCIANAAPKGDSIG